MYDADVGLIHMYSYWVEQHEHLYPKLNTYHNCHDFEAVKGWARENQIDMSEG